MSRGRARRGLSGRSPRTTDPATEGTGGPAPSLPLISNVPGEVARAELVACADYWRRHVRAPVQFAAGLQALHALGCDAFVEIGPGATLIGLGQRNVPG